MPAPFYHGSPPPRGPESLSAHVRDLANAFASAASVISDQYTILDNATSGLLTGTNPWQGQGATSFSTAWQAFGKYMQQMQKVCEDIYNSLIKFANKLSDVEAQQVWDILLTIAGGILTLISFVAAIAEFGLNPFVDGITAFFSGFTEQEGSSVVNAAEEITQADTQAATELQQVETELTTSPTLTGPTTDTPGGIPDPVSQVSIDEMTTTDDLLNMEIEQVEDESGTLYAKNNSRLFKNPINMDPTSTDANMPSGVSNPIGKYWIQQLKQLGVRVEWNRSIQTTLETDKALGGTYNYNSDPTNATPDYLVIGLSPDAGNATVYEEFLHAQEAANRGWMPPSDPPMGSLTEEIQVEYNVLQEAENLNMSNSDWARISTGRQAYIARLQALYQQKGLPWPPANLASYLQDPTKPANLP